MAAAREAIFLALMERLRTIKEVVTVEDHMKRWSDVPPDQQPAIFVVKESEVPTNARGLPPKWNLRARLYIYAHQMDRLDMSAQQQMNRLITRIEEALEVKGDEKADSTTPFATTLGGCVSHAWLDGQVETDEGTLGDQTVAIATIDMLTTG